MHLTPEDVAALLEALDLVVRTHGLNAAPLALALSQKLKAIADESADESAASIRD